MTGGGLAINHAINPHGEIVRQQIILGIDFSAFHQGGNFQQVFRPAHTNRTNSTAFAQGWAALSQKETLF